MQSDPKQGEREYFARIGPAGIRHATLKPFSEENCAANLAHLDALFHFLVPPPARIVEFGCGTGWLSLFLATRGYAVTGVDISPDAIAAARQQQELRGLTGVEFVVGDYEHPAAGEGFDYALFFDALHHAEDEQLAVQCAFDALRPGGAMIAFETREGHSETETSRRAVAEFGVHEKDMSCAKIAELGRRAGFRRHLVLPRAHETMRSLYRPSYAKATGAFDLRVRLFLSKLRVIRRLFSSGDETFIVLWK
jgi:SAM-dependent methyltransferase